MSDQLPGSLADWLESQEFYELMQTYRHTPVTEFVAVSTAFDAIKKRICFEFDTRFHKLAEGICTHQNCEMVDGRKQDYLYCRDCKTNLSDDGEG